MDLEDIMLSEVRERHILYAFTYMWNLKKNEHKTKRNSDTENTQVFVTGVGGGAKINEGTEVQTFSYKISKSQGYAIQQRGYSHNSIIALYGDRW